VHESVWRRLSKEDGPPLPSPYRDEQFPTLLAKFADRMEPLSQFEKDILRDLSTVPPQKLLPRSHQVTTFCDHVVRWLGGS
jgi:hypothetical protein